MLARRVLVGCLVSLAVGLPLAHAGKGDDPLQPRKGRKLDTDSPVAQALDALLAVDPRYSAEDGAVELIYDFKDETDATDWAMEGLDRVEEANARGRTGRDLRRAAMKPQALSLGAGGSPGVFVHRLELKGDYEATFRCHVERTTTRSDLVFLGGKAGASWGTQLVARKGGGFAPLSGGAAPDKEPWSGGRVVVITLKREGDVLSVAVNGARVDATTKLDPDELEGRVGLRLSDMHLVLHRVVIRGVPDPTKL